LTVSSGFLAYLFKFEGHTAANFFLQNFIFLVLSYFAELSVIWYHWWPAGSGGGGAGAESRRTLTNTYPLPFPPETAFKQDKEPIPKR